MRHKSQVRGLGLLAALLVLPVAAHAQIAAPNRLEVITHIAEACPGLILQDHAFTDAAATVLHGGAVLPAVGRRQAVTVPADARWGRNGKRGNPSDPSHDAVAWRNPTSPFGVSIVDIIGSAGSAAASPAWIDQTQATIDVRTTGVWVAPSGRLPPCLAGASSSPPDAATPPAPPAPPVVPDYTGQLAALASDLAVLRAELAAARTEAHGHREALYALIAEVLIAEHIDDIKKRVDAIAQAQQQSRPAPRWPW